MPFGDLFAYKYALGIIIVMFVIIILFIYTQNILNNKLDGVWIADNDFLASSHLGKMYMYINGGKPIGIFNKTYSVHLVMEDENGVDFIENRSGLLTITTDVIVLLKQLSTTSSEQRLKAKLELDYDPENDNVVQAIPINIDILIDSGHITIVSENNRYASLWKDAELSHAAKLY